MLIQGALTIMRTGWSNPFRLAFNLAGTAPSPRTSVSEVRAGSPLFFNRARVAEDLFDLGHPQGSADTISSRHEDQLASGFLAGNLSTYKASNSGRIDVGHI